MPEAGVVSPVQRSSGLSAVVNSILLRRRNPDWEAAFSRDFVEQQVEQMRFSVAMGIVLVFADFAFDVAANSNKLLLGNEVRLYVIVPLMVAIFSLSFATSLRRHYQILVTVFFVVLAPAFSLSLWLIDKQGWLGLTSYVGALNFMFITIFIFLFLGLRISYSLPIGIATYLAFVIPLFVNKTVSVSTFAYLYHATTVLLFGIFIGYVREFHYRHSFLMKTNLSAQMDLATSSHHVAGSPRDVFVSHSSQDAAVVADLTSMLEAEGITCWQSERDVVAGESWRSVVLYAIINCRAVVLILSNVSAGSSEVTKEIALARKYLRPIIPIRIEVLSVFGELDYEVANLHYIDVSEGLTDLRRERICADVRSAIRQSRAVDANSAV